MVSIIRDIMKKVILIVLACVSLILFGCENINTVSIDETKLHFYQYVDDLNKYNDKLTYDWSGREGTIYYYNKDKSVKYYNYDNIVFDLYNQDPYELLPFSKKTDDGYESYRIYVQRHFKNVDDICNFKNEYGEILSILLSKITNSNIDITVMENEFLDAGINKDSITPNNETDAKLTLYDTDLYINDVWCRYRLYYYGPPSKYNFEEEIVFGGLEADDNYIKQKQKTGNGSKLLKKSDLN